AWYAYANFHEFYDGFHGISSSAPARSPHAVTFATHSTHKLLCALSQASMIHIQNGEKTGVAMTRFNDAFMMHTSTSQQSGIPAAVLVKFLSSRRIEIEKTGLYSFLVLFSMGITKGKWSTLVTELLNFKDLYDANAPIKRVMPALAAAHPEVYGQMGLKELCEGIHKVYHDDHVAKAQKDMYTTIPEMALRPADAYDHLVHGRVEA